MAFALGLALLALAPRARPEVREPAVGMIGKVNGLSVARDVTTNRVHGTLFPITCTVSQGAGKLTTNVPLDARAIQMVRNAVAYLKRARDEGKLDLPGDFPEKYDIHVHFVDTALLVSGDSAGAAIALAIYSALTKTPILCDVAVTGAVRPDGKITSVGDIATKVDGVIRSGTGTMILPAENLVTTNNEVLALARKGLPQVRIVLVRNMDELFFYALGPFGPKRDEYKKFTDAHVKAYELAQSKKYEQALALYAQIRHDYPGDNAAYVWYQIVCEEYVDALVRGGRFALSQRRWADALRNARRALELAPSNAAARQLLYDAQHHIHCPAPTGAGPMVILKPAYTGLARPAPRKPAGNILPALWTEDDPRAPIADYWREAPCYAFELYPPQSDEAQGALVISAAYNYHGIYLYLTFPDPSKSAQRAKGRWTFADNKLALIGDEDAVRVVFDHDLRSGKSVAARAEELLAEGSLRTPRGTVDLWRWGAGTTAYVGIADDCTLSPQGEKPDSGSPPYKGNVRADGAGPAFVLDGRVGTLGVPDVVTMDAARRLSGSIVRGIALYRASCARCHERRKDLRGRITSGIAATPAGSAARLVRKLTSGTMSRYAPRTGIADLVAFLQAAGTPGAIVGEPDGSRADVKADARFAQGKWHLVLSRKFDTGHDDDVKLNGTTPCRVFVEIVDGASGTALWTRRIEIAFQPRWAGDR